jgi:enoyl-CoA hydratase
MEFITLDIREKERVALLTMNYKKENRFNPAMLAELNQALDEVENNDKAGALVATGGDPKFFSNGLDLEHIMMNMGDPAKVAAYLGLVNDLFKRVTLFPKPTVATLNGHTFAAGFFLAAHMDFRFMREDRGWACLPEVDINIPLLPGMIAICQAVMPPASFHQFYYTGGRFTGAQCKEMGFAQEVFSEEDLLPKSIEFAAMLAKKKTRTYAEMKRRIREPIARILEEKDAVMFADTLKFSMPGQ